MVAHVQGLRWRVANHVKSHGIVEGQADNLHHDPIITLNRFMTDPNSVRFEERVKAGKAARSTASRPT